MVVVSNVAGGVMFVAKSDAEACQWWLDSGRVGDMIDDELAADVVAEVLPDDEFHYDGNGCVRRTGAEEAF